MRSAYFMAAMPSEVLVPLLVRNGVSFGHRYLLRLAFLLQSSVWTSFLGAREKAIFGRHIASAPPPTDPVIIVGHWRTGSTLLHQMLGSDPQFAAPTLFQVSYPTSFMSSRRYVEPIMKRFLRSTRPMDNVKVGMDEPMEEEGAVFRMTGQSPFERLIFARSGEYFLLNDNTFAPPADIAGKWEKALVHFVTKIQLYSGRRPLLKNPFHSLRIPTLRRLFPDARFIHIYRDPRIVVPSTVRMWSIVGAENTMRRQWRAPHFEDVAVVFDRVLTRTREDLAQTPSDHWCQIRFEELESRPVEVIRAAYAHLGLEFSAGLERNLVNLSEGLASYRKNSYELGRDEDAYLRTTLRHHLEGDDYI